MFDQLLAYLPTILALLALVVSALALIAPKTATKLDDEALAFLQKLMAAAEKLEPPAGK